ncbi:phytanoyl-CoA dioxygenase family protein [Lentisphaera marina]|uniref:phytanoyl-CoA dioxygenase family protein n=1 Tax=Lentisphaera marina TaxID=1111041 RepID=UPI0023673E45|nr:phytanoyl-CoA dioxygenase family protein [Lentisphaera marina]MDD7985261.1 phytanoyl-CoA dioxygenase family protein [Lentisphaera marina]
MKSYRNGQNYFVSQEDKGFFLENGYVKLGQVLNEEELESIEQVYDAFKDRKLDCVKEMGKDFCDMSQDFSTDFEDYALINAMLPTKYHPEFAGNIFEKLATQISRQLLGDDMVKDYDQFLTKKPGKAKASFAMHQDMGYWPLTKDTRTTTCCLAITPSKRQNGCIGFIPGSGKAKELIKHSTKDDNSHTLTLDLPEGSQPVFVEVERGSITVHDEWIVHGSGGNVSNQYRKTYVLAHRAKETVKEERAMGFDHSHNSIDFRNVDA